MKKPRVGASGEDKDAGEEGKAMTAEASKDNKAE
jgi:hypothetical protein